MLLGAQRVRSWRRGPPARRASPVHRSPRRSTTAPPHATSASARKPARLRHMIVILHEQRIALARREHADRLRRHRPAGEPLHRRAEAVGAAEDEMLAVGLAPAAPRWRGGGAPSRPRRNAGIRRRGCARSRSAKSFAKLMSFSVERRATCGPRRAFAAFKAAVSSFHGYIVPSPSRSRRRDMALCAHHEISIPRMRRIADTIRYEICGAGRRLRAARGDHDACRPVKEAPSGLLAPERQRLDRSLPPRARRDRAPRRAALGGGSGDPVDAGREPDQVASRAHDLVLRDVSGSAECARATRFTTSASRSCSTPITSPPARAMRGRSAA